MAITFQIYTQAQSKKTFDSLRVQNEKFLEEKGFILCDTEKEA